MGAAGGSNGTSVSADGLNDLSGLGGDSQLSTETPSAAPTGSSDPLASPDNSASPDAPTDDPTSTSGGGGTGSGGATAGTIEIGAEYVSRSGITATAKLIGLDLDLGPLLEEAQAMVKHLNSQGGINGRQVKLVPFEQSTSASNATNSQAACAMWTQDHHVVAALTLLLQSSECLAKKNVIEIQGYNSANTPLASQLSKYPLFTMPNGLTLDRLATTYGTYMGANNYFKSPANAKVGIIYNDTPTFTTAYGMLKSSLAAKGVKVAAASPVPAFNDFSSLVDIQNALSGIVLQFRAAGVTHVMFLDNSTTASYLFAQNAASQKYYPRYGLNGSDAATIFAANNKNDAKILTGAQVLGYTPAYDTNAKADYETPAGKACSAIYTKAGIKITTAPNPVAYSYLICDAFRYIAATLNAGGANTPSAFLSGRAELAKKGFTAAMTFGSNGQPDGVRKMRIAEWQLACSCFKYVGPEFNTP